MSIEKNVIQEKRAGQRMMKGYIRTRICGRVLSKRERLQRSLAMLE